MGWWGCNVMEGDEPMDLLPTIQEDIIGVKEGDDPEFETDDEYDEFMAKRDAEVVAMLKAGEYMPTLQKIQAGEFEDIGETAIALQVLGEMVMVNGGMMSDEVKAIFIKAAEDDEWAQDDPEREEAMKAYIERVKAYDGVAIEPTSHGLFDTIFESIEKGHEGLINKK